MIAWKYKYWRTAGAAAAMTAGLAACGGEGGEGGGEAGQAGEGGEAAGSAPAPSAANATAPQGGEQGEAGAATAYAGLSGDQLTALRLQHLKGFVMAAARMANQPEAAAILLQQGLLEVYDVAPGQFGALDIAQVRAASDGAGTTAAQMTQRLQGAEHTIDFALENLEFDHAILVVRMVDIATGLYQGVIQEDFMDAIEYQHSMGAALAARDALASGRGELQRRDRRANAEAVAELDRFVALWPAPEAPPTPNPYAQVLAQGSRVRLALSPYL